MFEPNAIIMKECLQAARRRRTYVLRAGLPLATAALAGPAFVRIAWAWGQDWRLIAAYSRDLLGVMAWLALIAFSLLAFAYATASLHGEWRRRSMEVLAATPLTARQIVHAKFAAVLLKLGIPALALVPLTGILTQTARLPRDIMLGSLAVVAGGAVLCGSFGLLQAASYRPGRGGAKAFVWLLPPYYLVLMVAGVFVWPDHPVLEAGVSFVALARILEAAPPAGWSVGAFAWLTFGMHAGLSALALGLAPWLLARSVRRQGQPTRVRGPRWLGLGAGRRPPMGESEHPMAWLERGPATRLLGRGPWVAMVGGLALAAFLIQSGYATFDPAEFIEEVLPSLALAWAVALSGLAAVYGTTVFAREKDLRRAEMLVLTGCRPEEFCNAKVLATYRALIVPLGVGAVLGVLPVLNDPEPRTAWFALLTLWLLLAGPGLGVSVGLTFSVAGRSTLVAFGGLIGGAGWFAFLVMMTAMVPAVGILCVIGSLVFGTRWRRGWRVARLSIRLGSHLMCVGLLFGLLAAAIGLERTVPLIAFVVIAMVCVVSILVPAWLDAAANHFEEGMTGQWLSEKRAGP